VFCFVVLFFVCSLKKQGDDRFEKKESKGMKKKEKGKVSKQGESKRKIFFSYNSDAVERL
jgi:hypothetical protein